MFGKVLNTSFIILVISPGFQIGHFLVYPCSIFSVINIIYESFFYSTVFATIFRNKLLIIFFFELWEMDLSTRKMKLKSWRKFENVLKLFDDQIHEHIYYYDYVKKRVLVSTMNGKEAPVSYLYTETANFAVSSKDQ